MRPAPILLFARLYLTGIILGALSDLVSLRAAVATVASQGAPLGVNALFLIALTRVLIDGGLWYFVAHRASRVALWILTIWVVLQFGLLGLGIARGAFTGGLVGMLTVIAVVLKLAGIVQAFRRAAKPWFERGPAA